MSGLCMLQSPTQVVIPITHGPNYSDQGILQGNLQTDFVNGIVMVVFALLAMFAGIGYARYSARQP